VSDALTRITYRLDPAVACLAARLSQPCNP